MQFSELHAKPLGILMLFCTLLLLGGCAAVYGLKEDPKISIADIRIQDMKAMEGVFLIKLRVLNPNDAALDLRGINCDLAIGGRHLASGIAESGQSVAAYGTQIVPVLVYASVLDMVASLSDLMRNAGAISSNDKPVPYTLQGSVDVGIHGFRKQIPFKSAGELSLKGVKLPR